MSTLSKPARRMRIVGALVTLYSLGAIVFLIAMRPSGAPAWLDRDGNPGMIAAAAHDALESHPLGGLMVPYEHRRLERMVRDAQNSRSDSARDGASTVFVYYIVLGEMTLLLLAHFAVGLIGGLLTLRAGPISTLWAGVLLILAAPGPVASVGPGSVLLTLPLLVFGVLVLVLRPRVERAAAAVPAGASVAGGPVPATQIAGPAETHPGRDIAIGVGLIALGIGSGVLAAHLRSSGAVKVWIGAAAALGMGIWLLISGLIGLGKKQQP